MDKKDSNKGVKTGTAVKGKHTRNKTSLGISQQNSSNSLSGAKKGDGTSQKSGATGAKTATKKTELNKGNSKVVRGSMKGTPKKTVG